MADGQPTSALQMCHNLAAGLRSIEQTVAEVQRDLQHTREHVQNLREKSVQTYDDIHTLQVGLGDTNINLDKLNKELGRVGQATQQLQGNERMAKEKLTLLDEAQKMSETRLEAIIKDVTSAKESDKKLEDAVQRQINEDIRALRRELANTNLTVNQVSVEQKNTSTFAKENRDAFRDARVDIERMFNEVKKTNTVTNILENRLASTAKGLQQSWAKCAELSDALVKTMECYDKTKARVMDAEGQTKEISLFGKRTRDDVNAAIRQVEQNTDRLTQALKLIDEGQEAVQDMRHEINAVKQGQANSARQVNSLKGAIMEVQQTSSMNNNSITLPALSYDSGGQYSSTMSSPGRPESRKK